MNRERDPLGDPPPLPWPTDPKFWRAAVVGLFVIGFGIFCNSVAHVIRSGSGGDGVAWGTVFMAVAAMLMVYYYVPIRRDL